MNSRARGNRYGGLQVRSNGSVWVSLLVRFCTVWVSLSAWFCTAWIPTSDDRNRDGDNQGLLDALDWVVGWNRHNESMSTSSLTLHTRGDWSRGYGSGYWRSSHAGSSSDAITVSFQWCWCLGYRPDIKSSRLMQFNELQPSDSRLRCNSMVRHRRRRQLAGHSASSMSLTALTHLLKALRLSVV